MAPALQRHTDIQTLRPKKIFFKIVETLRRSVSTLNKASNDPGFTDPSVAGVFVFERM